MLVLVLAWTIISLAAPAITPYRPFEQKIVQRRKPPSGAHLFGTGQLGRDVLAAVISAGIIGTLVGALSGFLAGWVAEGYCYDFGRAVVFSNPGDEYRRVYKLVMQSQAAGIAALQAGNTCEQADAAARAIIADAGYGPAFRHRLGHGLGHGIGMNVHEPPFLTAGDSTVLRSGMCFMVEPSIFIPHKLGARVEDVVVVRAGGGEPLTTGFQQLHIVE